MDPSTDDRAGIAAKIQNGVLRHDVAQRVWGGKGNGRTCNACGRMIGPADLEIEADFADGQTLRFHPSCFTDWQRAAEQQRGLEAI